METGINMKGNSLTDKRAVLEYIPLMMAPDLKENLMERKRLKELYIILMEINSSENLGMMKKVEKDPIIIVFYFFFFFVS